MVKASKITPFEYFVYVLFNVLTLGGLFVSKVVIKKAISECFGQDV